MHVSAPPFDPADSLQPGFVLLTATRATPTLPPVMTAEMYWLPASQGVRLAVMPRPLGDDWLVHEVSGWQKAGLKCVVSLLEPREVEELGLSEEAPLCHAVGIEFLQFPIPDHGVPASVQETGDLADRLVAEVTLGHAIGIHCRAGIGRSALVAGCVLLRLGMREKDVFPAISQARGVSVPETSAQVKWLRTFARHGSKAV